MLHMDGDEEKLLFEELSSLPNGKVKEVLDRLTSKGLYVACIKASCCRDAQYSVCEDADLLDEEKWKDACGMPLLLKAVEADTPQRAKQMAAAYAGTDTNVVELYGLSQMLK